MKRYYVSHPFTGNEEMNLADAERIRTELKARYPNICFMNPLGMFGDENADYCTALADALELLSCCEAIILCPRWEKSIGCRAEKAYAIHTGIKIHYLDEFLNRAQTHQRRVTMNAGLTNDEFCRLVNSGRKSRMVSVIVAVYDHPQDFSHGYVARAHIIAHGGKAAYASQMIYIGRETLDEVRAAIPPDMVKMICYPQDDPVIIETYV
ncbi:DUF4406 domain-containing protein [Selenomonas sputigena]|uniref:DUF4406 domain-containing protein n=1 Tax=Selenomonas sputigena TaxID=69823 RepID=UPI002231856D|nr:DUF4406 domain-containing protein [Selenomonas sputigena]UZD44258.1 DUF4406 domain-containing protein [Selenomonas sputigena]